MLRRKRQLKNQYLKAGNRVGVRKFFGHAFHTGTDCTRKRDKTKQIDFTSKFL